MLAVAAPMTKVTSLVERALNVPLEVVLQLRSPAGLVVRAGAPGEVFVADQKAAVERTCSVQGAFALTVNVGPVVELNPASKSAVLGAERDVEPALIWSRTTRPAISETLPGTPQLSGAPLAVH